VDGKRKLLVRGVPKAGQKEKTDYKSNGNGICFLTAPGTDTC
jgi:hypothetical protein